MVGSFPKGIISHFGNFKLQNRRRSFAVKSLCIILSLLLVICTFCSCTSTNSKKNTAAEKSALKREISMRSAEEIASTGIVSDDVIAAFDKLLADVAARDGDTATVRFMAIVGSWVADKDGVYEGDWYVAKGGIVDFSIRIARSSTDGKSKYLNFWAPGEIVGNVLNSFGYVFGVARLFSDDFIDYGGGVYSTPPESGLLVNYPPIEESMIRNATQEQLTSLYTLATTLYDIEINKNESYRNREDADVTGYPLSVNIFRAVDEFKLISGAEVGDGYVLPTMWGKNYRPVDICIKREYRVGSNDPVYRAGIRNTQLCFVYDDDGNVTEIIENTSNADGVIISTESHPLEQLNSDYVLVLPKKGIQSEITLLPEKIGLLDPDFMHFYTPENQMESPDGCIPLYGFKYKDADGKEGYLVIRPDGKNHWRLDEWEPYSSVFSRNTY